MNPKNKKIIAYCLIGGIIAVLVLIFGKQHMDIGKEYLVEETGYIHSTDNKEKCHYIRDAKNKGYTISRISKEEAVKEEKQICRECYPVNEIWDYIKQLQVTVTKNQTIKDWMVWDMMDTFKNNTHFEYLYVYMESTGKLHLRGDCFKKDIDTERTKLSDIKSVESICPICVSRKYRNFIDNYIKTGKYDITLIDKAE